MLCVWEKRFEDIVRQYLPGFPGDDPLTPEVTLSQLGLDEAGARELGRALALEYLQEHRSDDPDATGFLPPGKATTTLGDLWSALSRPRGDPGERTADPDERPPVEVDVCVMGAGIVGLINAIQYAKRGLRVAIVDELTERGMAAYKVGESLLGYTNAFLRTIGDLDEEVAASFPKHGVWFVHGLEGRTTFEGLSEWGVQSALPERWRAVAKDPSFVRTMFQDAQIVRPEVEAVLRRRVAELDHIVVIDNGLVRHIRPGDDVAPHEITWRSRRSVAQGTVRARWMIDCTGRARTLVKRFGHSVPLDDGFATSAVWGQFAGCTDAVFDDRWSFRFPDGEQVRRDLDTVHLWGRGYWIWLIRLAGDRISVGVSFDQRNPPAEGNLREVFWSIIRRYPLLDFLVPENLLDFAAYRDVQHICDTYVSAGRYAIVGDAASIVDAYYSQGISLSLAESWHAANIVEEDLRRGTLDTEYIDHVNAAAQADWHMMRGMVKGKYGPALADGRYFVLDHLLDYLVFGAGLPGRYRIARWLNDTRGNTEAETPAQAAVRRQLGRRLFLSQSWPWSRLAPRTFARVLQGRRDGIERRAIWRLEHGVGVRPMTGVMRTDAPLPAVWRLLVRPAPKGGSVSPAPFREPEFLRPDISVKLPAALDAVGALLIVMVGLALLHDVIDTAVLRFALRWRRGARRRTDTGAAPAASPVAPTSPGVAAGRSRAERDLTAGVSGGEEIGA